MDAVSLRIVLNNSDDFWEAWLQERALFRRVCSYWLPGRPHEVEDVLSAGALKALSYVRRNPGAVRRFRPWALRLLHNLCIDCLRGNKPEVLPYGDDDEQIGNIQRGRSAAPEHEIFRREVGIAIERAIATLPSRLRETFELRVLEKLAYSEISVRLGISQTNARKRVQQARALLRAELDEIGYWRLD